MSLQGPTASAIRAANRNAVGGTRKHCRKGKACSATCIDPREECLVGLPEPVSISTTKVVAMLQSRKEKASTSSPASTQTQSPSPAAPASVTLSEKHQEKVDTQARSIDKRINRKLGGTPFDDPDPASQKYKDGLPLVKPFMGLDPKQKAAIGLYGENLDQFYKDVNTMLRTGKGTGDNERDNMSRFITENLKSALSKLPAAPGEYQRAVSGSFAQQLSGIKPGDVIQDKGFGSYTNQPKTLNMYINKDQPNAIIKINSKNFRNVSPVMEFDEGEHLSMPGSKYRLVSVDSEGFQSSKTGGSVPVYTFEEVQ